MDSTENLQILKRLETGSKSRTLIIDLQCFLLPHCKLTDSFASDRHADCQLNGGQRFHTRPYFEEFLVAIATNTDFFFGLAMNQSYETVIAYFQHLVHGKPNLKCL